MNDAVADNKRTILLVDEEPSDLQVLLGTLKNLGHGLLIAKNGKEALAAASRRRPDLIVIDLEHASDGGLDTLYGLQADELTACIPRLVVATQTDTRARTAGLQAGAADFLTKPYQADEVATRIQIHLHLGALEHALNERNQQLDSANRHILDAVRDGIYGLDKDGVITYANPAACRMTGYSRAEVVGSSIHELHLYARWDGSPYHFIQTGIASTLRSGEPSTSDDDVFWRQSGDHFAVSWQCAAIVQHGEVTGAVLSFQDITERRRQMTAMRNALDEVEHLRERLEQENRYLQQELRDEGKFDSVVGESAALLDVLQQIRQVAPTHSAVLIQGESGTGKEALARAIHDLSPRSNRALIKVNCGAITPTLIESELFGHEKGAFTGATKQHRGHFEIADGGTIFLDEIGELPLDAQVKLLRVLQEQEFSRIGSQTPIQVDVRVIAATNRDLAEMVEAGSFRMDLYYRLVVFPLQVPPLRDRTEDIPLLVQKFLADQSRALGREFTRVTEEGMQLLMNYSWPGNIRELQNVIQRAAILSTGRIVPIAADLVNSGINIQRAGTLNVETPPRERGSVTTTPVAEEDTELTTLADNEASYIRRVLRHTGGMVAGKGGAAEILGLPASTLRSRMKKLGVDRGN